MTDAEPVLVVWRHSGRTDGQWRRVPARDPQAKYERLRRDLRQGTVRLVTESGDIIRETSAPRLRTRW